MKRIRETSSVLGVALLGITCVPAQASANVGVPMLAVAWPLSWYAFLPIVLIEAYVARALLRLSWSTSSLSSLAANASSTLIGIPLTWGVLTLLAMAVTAGGRAYGLDTFPRRVMAVTVQAPWLVPYESELYWMVPVALLVLLPFFAVASVFIERTTFRRIARCSPEEANAWSWRSNLLTYGMAAIAVSVWLAVNVIRQRTNA